VREVWRSKRLGEVSTFHRGLWKGEKPPFVTVGVIRNTNFAADGSIDDSDIAWLEVEQKKFEKRQLKTGDIILERSGGGPKQPVGRVVLFEKTEGAYSFSNFTSVIRVNNPQELDFRFLHKFLFWKYASGVTEAMQSHSTGIRNLNADAYKDIVVPLPPLLLQYRIVAILDEAFAGLATATANVEKNLKNAHELFESYLNSVFNQSNPFSLSRSSHSFEIKRLPSKPDVRPQPDATSITKTGGRAATTRHIEGKRSLSVGMPKLDAREGWRWLALDELARMESGHTPSRRHPEYWGGHVPWIGIRDAKFAHGKEIFETLENTNALGLANSSARLLPAKTVCLSRTASVGYVTVMGRPMATSQDFVNWVCSDKLYPQFLMYLFLAQGEEIFNFSSGAVHQTIYFPEAKAFHICVPSITEQRHIVGMLDGIREQTEKLERVYQRKFGDLTEAKQSILQKAFAGELASDGGTVRARSVDTKTAGFAAYILMIAYERHRIAGRENTFGHKKAQKLLHLVDAVAGVDLGRDPLKDAAGPNDFDHMLRATDWAEQREIFKFNKSDKRYIFQRLQHYKRGLENAKLETQQYSKIIGEVIDLLLPMNSEGAEIVATVYAAWNNLIVQSKPVDDEAIVREAREDWHPEKMEIVRHKFFDAIALLRRKKFIPTGQAKLVREKYLI
jgi:restriction endonuclease S subunit